jgi:hypothetical protein
LKIPVIFSDLSYNYTGGDLEEEGIKGKDNGKMGGYGKIFLKGAKVKTEKVHEE